MSYHNRVLNWKPSPKDPRDKKFHTMRALRGAAPLVSLPPVYSLRAKCSPVRDQGQTGECTGESVVGAAEFLAMKTGDGKLPFRKSVKFAYYNGRRMMFPPQTFDDSGCYIRTVIKAAARYGICAEAMWPESNGYASKPNVSAYADATRFQLTEYASVEDDAPANTLDNVRRTIYSGLPVCFGFDVYSSFMTDAVAKSGLASIPTAETIEGGHAVLAVGYDDIRSLVEVKNSWGAQWGDAGYFWLPYWFLLRGHASDFRVISGQENGETAAGWFSGLPGYLFGHSERIAV